MRNSYDRKSLRENKRLVLILLFCMGMLAAGCGEIRKAEESADIPYVSNTDEEVSNESGDASKNAMEEHTDEESLSADAGKPYENAYEYERMQKLLDELREETESEE